MTIFLIKSDIYISNWQRSNIFFFLKLEKIPLNIFLVESQFFFFDKIAFLLRIRIISLLLSRLEFFGMFRNEGNRSTQLIVLDNTFKLVQFCPFQVVYNVVERKGTIIS